jgi:hypothetical protein
MGHVITHLLLVTMIIYVPLTIVTKTPVCVFMTQSIATIMMHAPPIAVPRVLDVYTLLKIVMMVTRVPTKLALQLLGA